MAKNYKVEKDNYPVFLLQNRKDEAAHTAGEIYIFLCRILISVWSRKLEIRK